MFSFVGRDGLTHNMLDVIHNHWKHAEAVRIKCMGVPTVDMKNICSQLEVFFPPHMTSYKNVLLPPVYGCKSFDFLFMKCRFVIVYILLFKVFKCLYSRKKHLGRLSIDMVANLYFIEVGIIRQGKGLWCH